MNLKEAFRYQRFLENMLTEASISIRRGDHCVKVTKTHFKKVVDPTAENIVEPVEREAFFNNDDVVAFMQWLVKEREELTKAISKAKSRIKFDIDAAVETNKFRQRTADAIRAMMGFTPSKRIEEGRGYKFNVEGNQMPYTYDIEVVSEEAYDRNNAKSVMRFMISEADKTSGEIELAVISTQVEYNPPYDVNDSFEDVMSDFITSHLSSRRD